MKYKLKEIFDLQMGKTPARNNDKYWNSKDYKWISIADLTSTDKYINNTKEYISQSAVTESGIKIIPANTVVMSFKLSIGKTAILSEDMYSNEAIMAFHDKHVVELLPEYIYYLIKAKNWNGGSNRAVMGQTLNKATLSEIEVDVHTIDEQRKIVELLNLVGEIIYKRNTQLSKLGDILSARFVEMFGDPVSNNKKWIMNTFGEICRVRQGLQIPISKRLINYEEGCYEYITVQYINGGKDREYIKNPKPTVICMEDDILMARTGNTGKVITGVRGVFHNNFFKIEFDRKKYNNAFIVQYLNLDFIKADIIRRAGVSTIPDLNHGEFYKIKIFEPPIELQNKFATFVSQVNKSKLLAASQPQIHIYKTLTLL